MCIQSQCLQAVLLHFSINLPIFQYFACFIKSSILLYVYTNLPNSSVFSKFYQYVCSEFSKNIGGYAVMCVFTIGVVYFVLKYYVDHCSIYYAYKPSAFNGRQFLHTSAVNFVGAVHLQLSMLFFSVVRLGRLL